jgi:hypothetical protein
MSDTPVNPKDDTFLRKVARFVANPATDWTELTAITEDAREFDLEKSELKAMIERKKRNDFVRRREFDTLRKVRREGLSPEQLAALGGTNSRIDDSEGRASDVAGPNMRGGQSVKAKIDAIEKQMVGGATRATPLAGDDPVLHKDVHITTSPGVMTRLTPAATALSSVNPAPPSFQADPVDRGHQVPTLINADDELLPALPPLPPDDEGLGAPLAFKPSPVTARVAPPAPAPMPRAPEVVKPVQATPAVALTPLTAPKPAAAPIVVGAGLSPLTPVRTTTVAMKTPLESMEVGEVVHDPELDAAVICFANAEFDDCEHTLTSLTKPNGQRASHGETWLVLFDLFRATGQQQKFESLALDYVQRFGSSAPQWYSLPRMVADAVAAERPKLPRTRGEIGWVCPASLDADGVHKLASTVMQLPLPWVLDWSALKHVEVEAAAELTAVYRQWATQVVDMRWLSGERFFDVMGTHAPSGARDADPAYWSARLEALRLANRPDQFDEMAIEYCVTYEVSPPSWESAQATVRIGGAGLTTQSPSLSQISSAPSTTMGSNHHDETDTIEVAELELSGQLVGDLSATLAKLDDRIAHAPFVKVSCTRLIRVDFVAAGDLLNWVVTQRNERRQLSFTDAHRLVALFFHAMGISEHSAVRIRTV